MVSMGVGEEGSGLPLTRMVNPARPVCSMPNRRSFRLTTEPQRAVGSENTLSVLFVRWRTERYLPAGQIDQMNKDQIEGKWRQLRGVMRERWGYFIADRRWVEAGRLDQSAGRAQELYGINKEESQRALREFWQRNRRWNIPSR